MRLVMIDLNYDEAARLYQQQKAMPGVAGLSSPRLPHHQSPRAFYIQGGAMMNGPELSKYEQVVERILTSYYGDSAEWHDEQTIEHGGDNLV